MSEFKYLGCVLDKSGAGVAECCRKVMSRRKVADAIGSLINGKGVQLECTRVLSEALVVSVLLYGRESGIWRGEWIGYLMCGLELC